MPATDNPHDWNGHFPEDIPLPAEEHDEITTFPLDQPLTDRERFIYELGRLRGMAEAASRMASKALEKARAV